MFFLSIFVLCLSRFLSFVWRWARGSRWRDKTEAWCADDGDDLGVVCAPVVARHPVAEVKEKVVALVEPWHEANRRSPKVLEFRETKGRLLDMTFEAPEASRILCGLRRKRARVSNPIWKSFGPLLFGPSSLLVLGGSVWVCCNGSGLGLGYGCIWVHG